MRYVCVCVFPKRPISIHTNSHSLDVGGCCALCCEWFISHPRLAGWPEAQMTNITINPPVPTSAAHCATSSLAHWPIYFRNPRQRLAGCTYICRSAQPQKGLPIKMSAFVYFKWVHATALSCILYKCIILDYTLHIHRTLASRINNWCKCPENYSQLKSSTKSFMQRCSDYIYGRRQRWMHSRLCAIYIHMYIMLLWVCMLYACSLHAIPRTLSVRSKCVCW